MARYRVGIVGCGRMGSTIDDEVVDYPAVLLPYSHAASYAEVAECELVAASDVSEVALENFRRRWGAGRLYLDYEEMLEKEELDIVSVTTPATDRHRAVMAIVRHGRVKGIYAEKALSVSLAEADEMVEAVNRSKMTLAVGCSRRWHPYFVKAKELINGGSIGRLRCITAFSPGSLSHSGSHILDIVRYYAGSEVSWLYGHCDPRKASTDDDIAGNGYIVFENGVKCFFNGMDPVLGSVELDLLGEGGRIRCMNNGTDWELWEAGNDRWHQPLRHPFPRPQRIVSPTVNAIRDIIRSIEKGRKPACSGEDGRAALEMAIAIRESERRGGERVDLPISDRSLRMASR